IQDSAGNATGLTKVGLGTWFYSPSASNYSIGGTDTVATASGTNTTLVTVNSTAGLVVGQTVTGGSLVAPQVITAITGPTTFRVSNNIATTLAVGTTLTFGAVTGFTGNVTITGGTLKMQPTANSGDGSDLISASGAGGKLIFGLDSLTNRATAAGTFE